MRVVVSFTTAALLAGTLAATSSAAVPNAVNGPTGRVALRSGWIARLDPSDQGRTVGWAQGGFAGRAVSLPYVFGATQVTGAAGIRAFQGSVGWYRHTLDVTTAGRYAIAFGSVNHRADVYVDGVRVATHLGTYLPFEARVTLAAGRHELVVRADWRDPAAMKAAGFHRTWFNFGGMSREVTLRRLGASEIASPTLTTRRYPSGAALVTISALVRNAAATRPVPVTGTLTRGDTQIAFSLGSPTVPAGAERTVRATVRVPDPELWQPGAPRLYDLDLHGGAVAANGTSESGWHARVGLRDLRWDGGALRLNGRALTLRGASLQEDVKGRGDALTGGDQDGVVGALYGIGANATRAQHPLDEGLLERLDAAGILVWQGVGPVDAPGSWTSVTRALQARARSRVLVTVRQAQLHPSIVAWNLANEVAGNGHAGGQVGYVQAMTRELHRRDPGRMVALDVWGEHAPSALGPMYRGVDAIGVTNYLGWYESPLVPTTRLEQLIRGRVARFSKVFAGKVLIVSEFGAEANAGNPSARPGGFAFQTRVLAAHLRQYRATPGLDGYLIWDLRDFAVSPRFAGGSIRRVVGPINLERGLNQKGLIAWDGTAKPSATAVRVLLQAAARAAAARGAL